MVKWEQLDPVIVKCADETSLCHSKKKPLTALKVLNFINRLPKKIPNDLDDIYKDMSVYQFRVLGFYMGSFYTPYGIKNMDTKYCMAICGAKTLYDFETLIEWVIANPHLHGIIKKNLLLNLFQKSVGFDFKPFSLSLDTLEKFLHHKAPI